MIPAHPVSDICRAGSFIPKWLFNWGNCPGQKFTLAVARGRGSAVSGVTLNTASSPPPYLPPLQFPRLPSPVSPNPQLQKPPVTRDMYYLFSFANAKTKQTMLWNPTKIMKERSSFGHIKSKHAGQKNPIHRALSLSTALLAGPHHDTTHPGTQWGKLKTYNLSDWWRSVQGPGSGQQQCPRCY